MEAAEENGDIQMVKENVQNIGEWWKKQWDKIDLKSSTWTNVNSCVLAHQVSTIKYLRKWLSTLEHINVSP